MNPSVVRHPAWLWLEPVPGTLAAHPLLQMCRKQQHSWQRPAEPVSPQAIKRMKASALVDHLFEEFNSHAAYIIEGRSLLALKP